MKTGTEWIGTKHTIYQAATGLQTLIPRFPATAALERPEGIVTGLVSLDPRALRHSRVGWNDDSFCLVQFLNRFDYIFIAAKYKAHNQDKQHGL